VRDTVAGAPGPSGGRAGERRHVAPGEQRAAVHASTERRAAIEAASQPEPRARRTGGAGEVVHGSGVVPGTLAALLAAAAVINGQVEGSPVPGRVAIAGAAILAVAAFGPMLLRRHPGEPWLPAMLVAGMAFKLLASLARYFTLVDGYGSVGDAQEYHEFAADYARGIAQPLADLRKTNFVRWLTGNVYGIFGIDMITGFFVYGIIAFVGAYLFYRAAVEGVPALNRRRFALAMFFLPSIAFWPSSIGKEALMQLGIGAALLGSARFLSGRVLRGLLVGAPGGYLLWTVRPHLLAMAVLSTGLAYYVGARRARAETSSLMRPVGLVVVAMLSVFAVTQAMEFLGMEEFSINAIEQELGEQVARTSQGGSEIEQSADVTLTPLSLPEGAVTVLLRPFVWEVESGFQILASAEAALITILVVQSAGSLAFSLRSFRRMPFLFLCWTLLALYSIAFSAFANMGLLVRQRSLVLPALFVLLFLDYKSGAAAEVDGRKEQEPALA